MSSTTVGARVSFIAAALVTIAAGLFVHSTSLVASGVWRDVLGDALWAMMIAWWIGMLVPAQLVQRRALIALVICWAVEFSQLYHAPGIDALRQTLLGALVLGSGFDARDLFAYAVGVAVAVSLELGARQAASRGATT